MGTDDLMRRVISAGDALPFAEARALMTALLAGDLSAREISDLLTALHERGETAEELAGFADAMRSAAVQLPLTDAERDEVVDTCGTGGDGCGTFNISTAVALVAAAAGVKVAKHGNRRVSSQCGSADVLEALCVPVEHTPESAAAALRRHGFAFLLATRMHPAMKAVVPVRRSLPFRTVFNLLGPMTNPAGARRQVIGVYSAEAVPLVAEALAFSGQMRHVLVVHGNDGMDEISLSGDTAAATVQGSDVHHHTITPADAGLSVSQEILPGGGALENAAILRSVFGGERGPCREVVVLNAAAVLLVADRVQSLRQGALLAQRMIDDGIVSRLLRTLAA